MGVNAREAGRDIRFDKVFGTTGPDEFILFLIELLRAFVIHLEDSSVAYVANMDTADLRVRTVAVLLDLGPMLLNGQGLNYMALWMRNSEMPGMLISRKAS